jgi:hypothetical protein
LQPDGRAAVTTDGDELYDVRPGAAPHPLSRHGGEVAFAGERIVFRSGDGLRVIEPEGRIRAVGVATGSLDAFTTSGTRVLWWANDCLLLADAAAPAAGAPAKGPCPRSEVQVDNGGPNPHLGRSLPVVLRCVAAPRRCRGTVRLRLTLEGAARPAVLNVPRRYSIRAGATRHLRVGLTERGYRLLRGEVVRAGDAVVGVEPRGDDGDRLSNHESAGILVLPRGAT